MKTKLLLLLTGLLLTGCATQSHGSAKPSVGPTLGEVQSMVQAHVGDSVIIGQIQNSNTRYHLTADQIIALKNAGASDAVLNALINTASKPAVQTSTVVQGPSVYPPVVFIPPPLPWFWWGWGPHWR